MWIKREIVLDYFKANYGKGFDIDNIKESCKSLRVYLQPKSIEKWLENKAEESGVDVEFAKKEYKFKTVKEVENVIDELFKWDAEKKKLENFSFRMIDYILNVETLKIYSKKCLQLCLLLEKLAGKSHLSNKIYEFFDFTIKDDKILNSLKNHPSTNKDGTKGYLYPHSFGGYVKQQYMPKDLKDRVYYIPSQNGQEKNLIRKKIID